MSPTQTSACRRHANEAVISVTRLSSIRQQMRATLAARSAGFTLIEFLMSLAIAGILLAVGVPSLRDLIVSQRIRSAANNLYSDLSYARAEAIKRNATVQVQSSGGSWISGWDVVFGGNALRSQSALTDVSYAGSAEINVVYNPDGRTNLSGTESFNFSYAGGGTVSMRCVVITPSGRPAVLIDGNRNGNCQDG